MKYTIELNNARQDTNTKVKESSKAVEIFSALVAGEDTNKYGKNTDVVVDHIKELANQAMQGNWQAKSELNAFVRYSMQPALQTRINLFEFMGKFDKIGYHEQAMITEYKHNTRSARQASQGDVTLSTLEQTERPMATHTMSGGFAVNYREVASGNLTKINEGIEQVKVDIHNKAMHFVIHTLYETIKNATGVKYFAETNGITKQALDDVLRKVRRNGKPGIVGDYSVVSQINGFQGYGDNAPNAYSDAALEEIRNGGFLGTYGGSAILEIPNQYNRQRLNKDGDNYDTVLPEGLLFVIPQGNNGFYPLQIVQRGDLMSATGFHVETGTEVTRFDLEIGAELVYPDAIGLISDTNFDAPTI